MDYMDQFYFERMNQNDAEKSYKFIENPKIDKSKNSYVILDDNKRLASKLNYYEYDIQNFDWILVSDLDTKPKYQRMGLGSKLLDELYKDISKSKNKGLYMFVKSNNSAAIRLYKKLGFKKIKDYKLKDGNYVIMAKGNQDIGQFDDMNFS